MTTLTRCVLGAVVIACVLLTVGMAIQQHRHRRLHADLWDGFCAGVCPSSPLCVPPICNPNPGSGQGS